MDAVSISALLGAVGTFIATLIAARNQSKELKANAKKQEDEAKETAQRQSAELNDQLAKRMKESWDEHARQRLEDATERSRILELLKECESHRVKDADERAQLRSELAYLKGKLDGLPMIPVQAAIESRK